MQPSPHDLNEELVPLADNTMRLKEFLCSPASDALPRLHRRAMERQLVGMEVYREALLDRIYLSKR